MQHMHMRHSGDGSALEIVLPAVALLVCAGAYLVLVHRARRRNPVRAWSLWRCVCFLTGLCLLGVALLPPLAPFAHSDFRGHMAQHLLVGMYAPLALVLGAPVTLLLRALPASRARRLTRVLHSRAAGLPAQPVVALLLSTGSLAVLYFTPLYDFAMAHPAGHWLLHAHFLLSGCLFAHAVAGPDPAPRRLGVRARLICLGCAIAAHSVMAQLMYGGFWADVHAPIPEVRGGAEIMYYGGDIAELLLAAALVATWRPERRTRPTPAASAPASCDPAGA
ncbi:cytochrome c oxidase assembly protein [Streptomyces sp. NPDC048514]|uniref:cytochrome c oxidase assembly protein n=1 Tax=Streptomyces sp. NPDC048514 TaxID=3365564 RepID=UPI00372305E5